MTLLLVALLTAGCMQDPVAADMEAFDRYGAAAFQDNVSKDLERRFLAARSREEQVAILDEWIAMMEKNIAAVDAYQAKTPEFGKILAGMRAALGDGLDGAKDMRSALISGNSLKANDATIKLAGSNRQMIEQMNALRRLAAEKGYTLKE
jgi:hypothetical protein